MPFLIGVYSELIGVYTKNLWINISNCLLILYAAILSIAMLFMENWTSADLIERYWGFNGSRHVWTGIIDASFGMVDAKKNCVTSDAIFNRGENWFNRGVHLTYLNEPKKFAALILYTKF